MASEAPTAGSRYHVVAFERDVEAAAFVAALARALDSKRLAGRAGSLSGVEVWSGRPGPAGAVVLYLGDGAFEAAADAFSPIPVKSERAALPAGCRQIVDRHTPPLGLEEALDRLSTQPNEGVGP